MKAELGQLGAYYTTYGELAAAFRVVQEENEFLRAHIADLTACLKPAQRAALAVTPPKEKPKLDPVIEEAIAFRRFDDRTEASNRRLAEELLAKGAKPDFIAATIKRGAVVPESDDELYAAYA